MGDGPAEESPIAFGGKRMAVVEAAAASAGLIFFALFAHARMPGFLLAIAGLLLTSLALARSFRSDESVRGILGLTGLSRRVALFGMIGIALGAGLAILARHASDMPLLPVGLEAFLFLAAAIGAAEELLYRGYVQGRLSPLGWPAAVIVAALAHTAYKTALFTFPSMDVRVQLSSLAVLTFLVGSAFGLTRHFSKSVLPPLAGHILFDIVVYGDRIQAPWWVWG